MGKKLYERLSVEDDSRLPIKAWVREPWTESVIEHEIAAELPGITGRNDTELNKLLASCKAIEEAGRQSPSTLMAQRQQAHAMVELRP